MTRNHAIDERTLEAEYVYADPPISLSDLAEKHGHARSAVAEYASKKDASGRTWWDKRQEFRNKVGEGVRAQVAESWVQRQIDMNEALVAAAMKYIARWEQALDKDEVRVSTRDMLGVAAMLLKINADMARQPAGDPDVLDGEAIDPIQAAQVIEEVKALLSGKEERNGTHDEEPV